MSAVHWTQCAAPSQTLPPPQSTPLALERFWHELSLVRQNAVWQVPAPLQAASFVHCTQCPAEQLPVPKLAEQLPPSPAARASHTCVFGLQDFCWHAPTAGQSASELQPVHWPEPSQVPA
jgi:hypothetical protein